MKKVLLLAALLAFVSAAAAPGRVFAGERKINRELDLKKGSEIRLDLGSGGDIYIEGWGKDMLSAKVTIDGRDYKDVDIEFEETSSGVEIHSDKCHTFRGCKADITLILKVPEEADIHFSTTGGDIEIRGIKGEFSGRTMGGDINFENLEGYAKVTTMGGDVTVSDCVLDGRVKTFGGDVQIKDVKGDLRGSTMGGDVTYRGVERKKKKGDDDDDEISVSSFGGDLDLDYEGQEVKARTFGGDVDVKRAEKVQVKTFGGDIEVDEAPAGADVHTMGGDITVHEAGEYVVAKTMGGDITVGRIDGSVKATTMGGDVKVRMVGDPDKGERNVKLKSMGGDIELVVPKGLSMKFDIEISYTRKSRKNYQIHSDFPVKIEKTKEWKRKWGQKRKYIYGTGEVNGGRNVIYIRTMNGNVFIKEGE